MTTPAVRQPDNTKQMSPYLRKLLDERSSHVAVIQQIDDNAARENRDVTNEEHRTRETRAARIEQIDRDLEFEQRLAVGNAKYVQLIGARYEAEERAARAYADHRDGAGTPTRTTLVERFTSAPEVRSWNGHGSSGRVELPGPASLEFRAAITLAGFSEQPAELAVPPHVQPVAPFLDLLGLVPTGQSVVQYLRVGVETAADVVAEGAQKPEGTGATDLLTAELQTVAVWRSASRQALEDIGQLQQLLQDRLLGAVRLKLEELAVAALVADTDVQAVTGPSWAAAVRRGIASVQSLGYSPSAVVMNPGDAADLDTAGLVYPGAGLQPGSPWGVPVVPSKSVPAGAAYVGDWRQGMTWFDRGTTDAYLSDSHADLFIRNVLVVLAEARAAFAVTDPAAIVKVSIGTDSGTGTGGTTPGS